MQHWWANNVIFEAKAHSCCFNFLSLQVSSAQSNGNSASSTPSRKPQPPAPKVRKSVSSRIHEAVKAIALCHNVTPVYESRINGASTEPESTEADQDFSDDNRTYQASSPDEVRMMGRPEINCI